MQLDRKSINFEIMAEWDSNPSSAMYSSDFMMLQFLSHLESGNNDTCFLGLLGTLNEKAIM